jgi:hypothetical protein
MPLSEKYNTKAAALYRDKVWIWLLFIQFLNLVFI